MSEFRKEVSEIKKSDTPINPNVHNLKNSMCFRTWNDLIISMPKRMVSWCCKTKFTKEQEKQATFDLDILNEQGLDFLINHPILQQRKYDLSGGTRSNDCRKCWETEDASGHSVRTQYNEHFEPMWKNRLRSASNHPKKSILFHQSMQQHDGVCFIELELTNKCNMACVYCWEGLSSRWQKELKRPMPETDDEIFDKIIELLNEYWDKKLKYESDINISLIGGEPFFTSHMFDFLNKFIKKVSKEKNDKAKFTVTVTTNLNFTEKRFKEFAEIVSETPNITYDMQISNEAIGRKAELIRWGLNFEKFDNTLSDFIELAKKQKNILLGFGAAHNSLSTPYMLDYFKYLDNKLQSHQYDRHIHMHSNWVDAPSHMGVQMVDKKHLSAVEKALDFVENEFKTEIIYKEKYMEALYTVKNIVDSDVSDEAKRLANIEFSMVENRRGISFAEYFPHYNELIKRN